MQKLERSLPREQVQRKQTKIQSSLRRLTPGGSAEIGAVLKEDGEIVTEANEIADALKKHWQETFSGKSTDPVLRREWLQRIRNKFKVDAGALKPIINDAKDAIDMTSSQQPIAAAALRLGKGGSSFEASIKDLPEGLNWTKHPN